MQTDQNSQQQCGAAQNGVVACVGCADGHALGHIVQRDSAGHHNTCHEQTQTVVLGTVMLQMVGVDQLIQVVSSLGMVLVNMTDLGVCHLIDEVVQNEGHGNADGNGRQHDPDADLGMHRLGDQVAADDRQHDAAGEAQQQADHAVGILLKQGANETAKTCANHARQGGCQDQCS